jgi:hypothetical protein
LQLFHEPVTCRSEIALRDENDGLTTASGDPHRMSRFGELCQLAKMPTRVSQAVRLHG